VTWVPHLHDALRLGHCERLGVGIGDDEVDPLQSGSDHVVDGVAPAPPTPNTVMRGLSSLMSGE